MGAPSIASLPLWQRANTASITIIDITIINERWQSQKQGLRRSTEVNNLRSGENEGQTIPQGICCSTPLYSTPTNFQRCGRISLSSRTASWTSSLLTRIIRGALFYWTYMIWSSVHISCSWHWGKVWLLYPYWSPLTLWPLEEGEPQLANFDPCWRSREFHGWLSEAFQNSLDGAVLDWSGTVLGEVKGIFDLEVAGWEEGNSWEGEKEVCVFPLNLHASQGILCTPSSPPYKCSLRSQRTTVGEHQTAIVIG